MRLTATFRSLHVRNFRLFIVGLIVSATGSWMQGVAAPWLVLQLTGSGVALGIDTALQFLPILLFHSERCQDGRNGPLHCVIDTVVLQSLLLGQRLCNDNLDIGFIHPSPPDDPRNIFEAAFSEIE